MQALRARGLVKAYTHGYGLNATLHALVLRPSIVGMTWLTGCDSPDANDVVSYTGSARGGHEIEIVGLDVAAKLVWMANSWGAGWGLSGYLAMSWSDFAKALADNGDVVFALLARRRALASRPSRKLTP
jgi:C1A family cysteine protease